MTGVTSGDFKEFQLKEKLDIPSNVVLDAVQMISVVATGCHVSFSYISCCFVCDLGVLLTLRIFLDQTCNTNFINEKKFNLPHFCA